MAPWLALLESFLVQQLLRTPGFHRGVEKVARQVHRVRHGIHPDDMGGTKIDTPGGSSSEFRKHFLDEIKGQLGRAEREEARMTQQSVTSQPPRKPVAAETKAEAEDAEAAWAELARRAKEPEKRGFMGEYIDALRSQVKSK